MAKKKYKFTPEELAQRQITHGPCPYLDLYDIFDNKTPAEAVERQQEYFKNLQLSSNALEMRTRVSYNDSSDGYEVQVTTTRYETDAELYDRLEYDRQRRERKAERAALAEARRLKREQKAREKAISELTLDQTLREAEYAQFLALKAKFEPVNSDEG